MERQGDEVHVETDEARGGSTPNIVRWILIASLLLAIVLLSITWISGALTREVRGREATTTDRAADAAANEGDDTDSIVSDNADEIADAPSGAAAEPGRVEN